MDITTTYKTNGAGTGQIVARGLGGKQKTTTYDHALNVNRNHGVAAANLIIHVQRTSPELQYGDSLPRNAVRSLDAGYGSHTVDDDGRHHFDI